MLASCSLLSWRESLCKRRNERRVWKAPDQMVFPEAIGMAIEGIESASFLTVEQKRDIFYNNAARFLRLN